MTTPEEIIKNELQQLPVVLQGFVGKQFGQRALSSGYRSGASKQPFSDATARNTGDVLRIASGRLFRSLARNNAENIYNLSIAGGTAEVEYGTKVPYAAIHEYGGTIAARFVASRGKMHRYFWAKFYATGDERWKFTALKIARQGGVNLPAVNIKARPYISKGLTEFGEKGLPVILSRITAKIMENAVGNLGGN
jgi:phage gpG-like protein